MESQVYRNTVNYLKGLALLKQTKMIWLYSPLLKNILPETVAALANPQSLKRKQTASKAPKVKAPVWMREVEGSIPGLAIAKAYKIWTSNLCCLAFDSTRTCLFSHTLVAMYSIVSEESSLSCKLQERDSQSKLV